MNTKYRILKKELCGRVWYEIQYKLLFWWFYETYGDESGTYNMSFDTQKTAESYICKLQSPKITIINI